MNTALGSCLCGAVRFEIDLPAKWCANCHCSMCRRAHAAAFVAWVGVGREHFRWLAGEEGVVTYTSSPAAFRRFCGACGSPLQFQGQRWADEIHLPRALLPDDLDLRPTAHAYADFHAPWVEITDALPQFRAPQ